MDDIALKVRPELDQRIEQLRTLGATRYLQEVVQADSAMRRTLSSKPAKRKSRLRTFLLFGH